MDRKLSPEGGYLMSHKGKPHVRAKDPSDESIDASKDPFPTLGPEAQILKFRKIEDEILSPFWAWRTGARPEH
jgi:hypothetical protein